MGREEQNGPFLKSWPMVAVAAVLWDSTKTRPATRIYHRVLTHTLYSSPRPSAPKGEGGSDKEPRYRDFFDYTDSHRSRYYLAGTVLVLTLLVLVAIEEPPLLVLD